MNSMVDRLVAESSVVRLFRYEQPSLVDCEPSSNSVCFHGSWIEEPAGVQGKSLFWDAHSPLGLIQVQKPHKLGAS
jgi:hypothetical protein